MQKPIGIIGGGNMGEALITGITRAQLLSPEEIAVSEPLRERREVLQKQFRVAAKANNKELVSYAPTLILAVKPQVVPEVLGEIRSVLAPNHLLISICAGIPLGYIQSFFSHPVRMIRAMPNTPALIQKGATALAPSLAATAEDLTAAEAVFQAVGTTVVVRESQMDVVTGLSGSGPAYILTFIEALIAGAMKEGLPQAMALSLITQTVSGTAQLIQATAKHPAILRDQVCTPGGTTMAGLWALEAGGFRAALMSAVVTATQRSKELSNELVKTDSLNPRDPKE